MGVTPLYCKHYSPLTSDEIRAPLLCAGGTAGVQETREASEKGKPLSQMWTMSDKWHLCDYNDASKVDVTC